MAAFYDVDAYYTHDPKSEANTETTGPMQRIQTKLSWLCDKGVEPNKKWWSKALGGKRLRILEVGCGNGSNLSTFASLGHEVVGVEPDPVALAVAQKRGHLAFSGTAEALPDEVCNDSFDVVVFMHVLEHCINPSIAVKNAVNLLNPDGRFVAEVPNNECCGVRRFEELWHWLDVPRHLNFFTSASLQALAIDSGLHLDSICFRGYCRQFSSGWKKAQEAIANSYGSTRDRRLASGSYWLYFMETAWSSNRQKYDSVRVICTVT